MEIIREALSTINASNLNNKKTMFHSTSPIYKTSNERLEEYHKLLLSKKRILSVIASGDQIINSMIIKPETIDCFDISLYPKYYLMLKIAAIRTLTLDEYFEFFLEDTLTTKDEIYDDLYFYKIRSALDKEFKEFWDALFNHTDWYEIYNSTLFSSEPTNKTIAQTRNQYLLKDNYVKLKSIIPKINLNFYDGNILDINSQFIAKYDLIYLSNIVTYVDKLKYKEMLYKLPLEKQGLIITYMFGNIDRYREFFNEKEFSIDIFPTNNPNDESGLLLFKK